MQTYFGSDIKEALEKIYKKNVVDNSDMDSDTLTFLVALNNKGYNAHTIKISNNASIETLDKAIKYKDLYFLEVSILDNILDYSIWKYPKKTNGETLEVQTKNFKRSHQKYIKKLDNLIKEFSLTIKG